MKKSLVAVLLSMVALTLVAGAAFAGTSFDITAKVDGTETVFTVSKWVELSSPDVADGKTLKDEQYSSTEKAIELTGSVVGVTLSQDKSMGFELSYFTVADGKLTKASGLTESGSYVLGAMSDDVAYAFKATVTINGSEEKGNPTTVDKASDAALKAAKAKFPDGTKMFDASVFESELTSKDYDAIKNDLANLALYTAPANIDSDGAIIFKIKLTGIDKGMLLKWVSILLDSIVTGDAVTISAATEIPVVYYFDDATGNEIMLNDVTTADNQEVDVAFAVTAGRQVFGVSSEKAATSGGSPSSGCDMGLLGSLALFAVALLPLRKSK